MPTPAEERDVWYDPVLKKMRKGPRPGAQDHEPTETQADALEVAPVPSATPTPKRSPLSKKPEKKDFGPGLAGAAEYEKKRRQWNQEHPGDPAS